jgi:hypothetical protein
LVIIMIEQGQVELLRQSPSPYNAHPTMASSAPMM